MSVPAEQIKLLSLNHMPPHIIAIYIFKITDVGARKLAMRSIPENLKIKVSIEYTKLTENLKGKTAEGAQATFEKLYQDAESFVLEESKKAQRPPIGGKGPGAANAAQREREAKEARDLEEAKERSEKEQDPIQQAIQASLAEAQLTQEERYARDLKRAMAESAAQPKAKVNPKDQDEEAILAQILAESEAEEDSRQRGILYALQRAQDREGNQLARPAVIDEAVRGAYAAAPRAYAAGSDPSIFSKSLLGKP